MKGGGGSADFLHWPSQCLGPVLTAHVLSSTVFKEPKHLSKNRRITPHAKPNLGLKPASLIRQQNVNFQWDLHNHYNCNSLWCTFEVSSKAFLQIGKVG